ncbi:MAG: metal ABC transporter substrate-binding protein [Oscillospiraceae bacterium]|jgi:zinc transport system substrate-binding protein|nr:metal ABC transporter substrate-binding protein [Oscillospiraceae bacterium]
MKKTLSITILLAMLCALLSGCGAQSEPEGEGISVVATVFAPYDFARQLVGERGEVTLLLPPGSEAHSYEPSPKDIIEIQNCDLFIYVGGVSDAWVSDVLESVGGEVRTVTLMDCVELLEEEHVEGMEVDEDEHEGEIEYDEHVWTSPRNAELICEKIAAALCEVDPEGAEEYGTALESYCAQLDELDAAFTEVVENGVRDTVVFGDRFPLLYFAKAYGLNYYAAWPGCADEAEPSAATVTFLIDKVKAEGIPVVFHIELSNEDMADTICNETGAKKMLFSACHNVTRAQFDAGVTYLELMWQNVDALREALG